ncbi:succinylglutamate desuccinylase/aspartoacylase family protein (plasmid) [Haloferacaceae archaeon DSL9]
MDIRSEHEPNESNRGRSRRSFLAKTGGFAAALSVGTVGVKNAAAHEIEWYAIRDGTRDRTTVYVTEANRSGPTVFVIGGQHGDEPSGWMAANEIAQWQLESGKLVVVPEANPVAIRDRTYTTDEGNLNRQWTIGSDPATPLSRAIWGVVEDHDPDVFFDLHSSFGIYGSDWGPDGIGQAVFPTPHDYAPRLASYASTYVNRNFIPDSYRDEYDFQRGPTREGDLPRFIHKVAADLEKPGFVVESTRYETPLDRRVIWTRRVVTDVLRHLEVL